MPVAQQINQEWVRIVGLIEAAEKGNGKRQLEAASLAFSNRSSFLTLRVLTGVKATRPKGFVELAIVLACVFGIEWLCFLDSQTRNQLKDLGV
jgi:hypothetical protein